MNPTHNFTINIHVLITKQEVRPILNYYPLLDHSHKYRNYYADPNIRLRPTEGQM
jgi:hypothetical protein